MSEFLVEVTAGREVVYRTTRALREAMRSGEITPDSRIFHRVSSQWLPITKHPEYRRFLTDSPPHASTPPATPEPATSVPPEPEPASAGWLTVASQGVAAGWRRLKRLLARPPVPPPRPPDPPRRSPPRDRWTFLP